MAWDANQAKQEIANGRRFGAKRVMQAVCMNKGNYLVLVAAALMVACGCGNEVKETFSDGDVAGGGVITVEKKTAERSRVFNIGGQDRTVSFSASMEYPMHYAIPRKEYRNLTGLVNEIFNNGTNFETSVENISKALFGCFDGSSTNEIPEIENDYRVSIEGKMLFADERYFSYVMEVHGSGLENVARTYDRKKGGVITLADLVATNDFGVVCKSVRDYVKLAMGPMFNDQDAKLDREIAKVLLKKNSAFNLDKDGLVMLFKRNEWHMGINMEIRVSWDSIKDVLIDRAMIPTGKFNEKAVHIVDETDPEWWRFPIEKYESDVSEPPKFLWEGTNYPHANVSHRIDIPQQGNIPKEKYDLFQSALGAFITGGMKPHATIKEAVYRQTVKFWARHIEKSKNRHEDYYGIYGLHSSVAYRGPEYVSYTLAEGDVGTFHSDFVWNWRTMRQLKIEEVIDMGKRRQLWEMIREGAAEYGGESFEWPSWAKEWPRDMSKFRLDLAGVYWGYWAGDIFAGANGHMTIFLPWERLRPLLRNDFVMPSK